MTSLQSYPDHLSVFKVLQGHQFSGRSDVIVTSGVLFGLGNRGGSIFDSMDEPTVVFGLSLVLKDGGGPSLFRYE